MKVLVLPGDGIGPEISAQGVKVLNALARCGAPIELIDDLIGADALEKSGDPLPETTLARARKADAILLGSVGAPGYEALPCGKRPADGLSRLRRELMLFVNFRPVRIYGELVHASSLKSNVIEGLDLVVLREISGDIYFGSPRGPDPFARNERACVNTMRYTESEIERIAHVAFRTARRRRRKVCSVDKADILETMELWRAIMSEVGRHYPDVELTHLLVDTAAMTLVRAPKQFDVIVVSNMFGDILSEQAAMLTGSTGMLPSASLGYDRNGLYQPVTGLASDIAGKNIANPLGAILSVALMLKHSFSEEPAAMRIEAAVASVIHDGYRTADIMEPGAHCVGTEEMGDAVAAAI